MDTNKLEGLSATEAGKEIVVAIAKKADKSDIDAIKKELSEEFKASIKTASGSIQEVSEKLTEVDQRLSLQRDASTEEESYEWVEQDDGRVGKDFHYTRERRVVQRSRRIALKSIDQQYQVPGSPESSVMPYHALTAGAPLMPYVASNPVTGSKFHVPEVGGFEFTTENTAPNNTQRTAQGKLSSRDESVDTVTGELVVSEPAADDLPALREVASSLIMDVAGTKHGSDLHGVIKATVGNTEASQFKRVVTGRAAALPTEANVEGITRNMRDAIRPQYRAMSARWCFSPELFSLIASQAGDDNHWVRYSPDGTLYLWGYPTAEDGNFDDGTTAGDLSGAFGNFSRAIMLGDRETLELREYDATRPGQITMFSRMRYKYVRYDQNAVVGLISAAS